MSKNNTVDTAQKGQTATKNNIPTGKVKTLANATERRKTREEQFRNFRINALRRRCKRMKLDDEKTEELVKKLIEQMNSPKEYNIIVMFDNSDYNMLKEAVENAKIKYNVLISGNTKARVSLAYMSLEGDQNVLAKLREIAPASAKIYPYAKKMESVLPKAEPKKKKPSNNSKEKAADAKVARKEKNIRIHRSKKTGKIENRKMSNRPGRHSNSTKTFTKKITFKTLSAVKKRKPSVVVHLNPKKASEGSKTAKKAA